VGAGVARVLSKFIRHIQHHQHNDKDDNPIISPHNIDPPRQHNFTGLLDSKSDYLETTGEIQ